MIEEIKTRRICRFKQYEIPTEAINKIIQAGRLAPSGKNKQPWKFIIYGGDAKRDLLGKMEAGLQRELNGQEMLLSKHPNNDVLYYDHLYECGVVAFERK